MGRLKVSIVMLLLVGMLLPAPVLAQFGGYVDLEHHWARDSIEELYGVHALDDPAPLYGPDNPITRGKVSRYLTMGWGIPPYTGDRQFLSDVPASHPYYRHANALYIRRLMVGVGGGLFGVEEPLSREQAATVLVRATGLETEALARTLSDAQAIASRYTDASQISSWAIPYVAQAYVSGLFIGDVAGTFRPLSPMSKAEAATVVSRIRSLKSLLDFGDAPDWPPYFLFPSLASSDGARHKDYQTVWLGDRSDGEIDSRQINSDFFDDGFVRFLPSEEAYPSKGIQIEFRVSVASRDSSLYGEDEDNALYFNLLVDFDHSMTWEEDEWVVRNMVINPNDWPAGAKTVTLRSSSFAAPVDPYTCWFRMTLTKGEKAPQGWTGHGLFRYGETEDYGPEEQKLVVLERLKKLVEEWSSSANQALGLTSADLEAIIPLVEDLIAEEQADDPVEILIEKKKVILDRLDAAFRRALQLGANNQQVKQAWEWLWKLMAYVTEEEAKRYTVETLQEALRLNWGIPPSASAKTHDVLDRILDLIYEQQVGDPPNVLLAKKDQIIKELTDLKDSLEKDGLSSAADRVQTALGLMLFIKALEQPVPPDEPIPPVPPDEPQPPESPNGDGTVPALPGVITGVQSVFELHNGRILMKVHLTNAVDVPVHDIEIYYEHQHNWPQGATLSPRVSPEGWEATGGSTGVKFYGETPLVPCTPVYIEMDCDAAGLDFITLVLTDKDHKPIGSSASQRVAHGSVHLLPQQPTNLALALEAPMPSGDEWDVVLVAEGGSLILLANADSGGGILELANPDELLPGGYAPETGYSGSMGPVETGEWYVLKDHSGHGYAMLLVEVASQGGCTMECWYNPGGSLLMVNP